MTPHMGTDSVMVGPSLWSQRPRRSSAGYFRTELKKPFQKQSRYENGLINQSTDLWTQGEGEGEGEMYGESNMETYNTMCKIDNQWELAL